MRRRVVWLAVLLCVGSIAGARGISAAPAASPGAGPGKEKPIPPVTVKPVLKPYKVSATLKEVSNARQLRGTPEQRKLLAQNLFVATPTDEKQLFFIYENNDYGNIPSFVTTDLVLQLYHVFFGFTLRKVESEKLMPLLCRLTEGMLRQSIVTWRALYDPKLKEAALHNVAYFAVAADGLGLKAEVPPEAEALARKDLELIEKHEGFELGAIFPYKIDYSQFVPRGHYTRTETLKRFFKAMMWYGLAPLSFYRQENAGVGSDDKRLVKVVRSDETVRMGILLTRGLYQARLQDVWESIYEPTAFFVGFSDDLTPAEHQAMMDEVFGKDAPVAAYADTAKFDAFVERGKWSRQPLIKPRVEHSRRKTDPVVPWMLLPFPDPDTSQLRVMGQRYIPDSAMLQGLSIPYERFFPAGMDVMAVLGSQRAAWLLDTGFPREFDTQKWPDYRPERAKLTAEFAKVNEVQWTRNIYWGWLWALQALIQPAGEGYPSFMHNVAWQDKSLNTALGSWAELRHDTILYGKQSVTVAECGGGDEEEPPMPKGYVEPNPEFYRRLQVLTRLSKDGLVRRKLITPELQEKFESLEDMLVFLRTVSEKELAGRKLTREEYEQIRILGSEVERLTLSVVGDGISSWSEVTETDRDMAVIADVHTGGEAPKIMALEEGVGHANEILVIVPVEGKLQINRGAVFSYYEFLHPYDDRLTDEKWQEMLKTGKAPAMPVWTRSFLAPRPKPVKGKPPESMQVLQYSSGC